MFKIHIRIVLGRPTLHPTSVHACPNETLTFTCSDNQVVATLWKLDMYIEENAREITFSSSQPTGSHTVIYMDMISANLSEVTRRNGSAADHYIIQVEDGTVLETPGPTYSYDIMYNTSLSVNISAHNCAGYSDPFPLVLQYDDEG